MKFITKLKVIAGRLEKKMPEIKRTMIYASKYAKLSVKNIGIKPGTSRALRTTVTGDQVGAAQYLLGTDIWLISELRKELKDAPVVEVRISELCASSINSPKAVGFDGGVDDLRLELADTDYPIYITSGGVVVDGNHRVLKLHNAGKETVKAIYVGKPHLTIPRF